MENNNASTHFRQLLVTAVYVHIKEHGLSATRNVIEAKLICPEEAAERRNEVHHHLAAAVATSSSSPFLPSSSSFTNIRWADLEDDE